MPHIVERKRAAESLRRGDIVVFNRREHTVEHVDVKVKWATMTFQELTEPYRIEKFKEMTVLVEEDTPKEAFDKVIVACTDHFEKLLLESQDDMDKAAGVFKAQIDSNYLVDQYHVNNFLRAQTLYSFCRRIELELRRKDGEAWAARSERKPLREVLDRVDGEELCELFIEAMDEVTRNRSRESVSSYRLDLQSVMEIHRYEALADFSRQIRMYTHMYNRAKKILSEAP